MSYENMIERLKYMSAKQLIELFHDIDDLQRIEYIGNLATAFWLDKRIGRKELSQDEDARQIDTLRRLRELK